MCLMSHPTTPNRTIVTLTNPKSPISEAYRTLRTNISFSTADTELKTIMVTSAGPAEGKSTTVCNIAVTYAQAEQKVLIIDCDLRKPTVHRSFHVTNRVGLTNVLTNQASIDEAIRETEQPNLHVITSGPIPPNPSELLGSKRMVTLLQELRKRFDIIIIDTPPVLAITDAQVVSALTDGVIMVIDSGKVKKEYAQRAKANLEQVKARILGVVLNNVSRTEGEAYYYYYYGSEESKS